MSLIQTRQSGLYGTAIGNVKIITKFFPTATEMGLANFAVFVADQPYWFAGVRSVLTTIGGGGDTGLGIDKRPNGQGSGTGLLVIPTDNTRVAQQPLTSFATPGLIAGVPIELLQEGDRITAGGATTTAAGLLVCFFLIPLPDTIHWYPGF